MSYNNVKVALDSSKVVITPPDEVRVNITQATETVPVVNITPDTTKITVTPPDVVSVTVSHSGLEGPDGPSAYEVAVTNGFVGTEPEWLASLVGPEGPEGPEGPVGPGIAEGGTTGQVLVKASADGFDTTWVDAAGGGASVTVDTRANILALAGEDGDLAYASDTQEALIYQGGWKQSSALHDTRQGSVDMGVEQASNLAGYGPDYVTDKTLSNVAVGGNADPREGAVRRVFSSSLGRNLFQVYLQGDWQTILTGVNIQTDVTEDIPDIEFTDFEPWVLSLITGNSDRLALDGTPLVKEMKIDMGAYSADLVIDGGSF